MHAGTLNCLINWNSNVSKWSICYWWLHYMPCCILIGFNVLLNYVAPGGILSVLALEIALQIKSSSMQALHLDLSQMHCEIKFIPLYQSLKPLDFTIINNVSETIETHWQWMHEINLQLAQSRDSEKFYRSSGWTSCWNALLLEPDEESMKYTDDTWTEIVKRRNWKTA